MTVLVPDDATLGPFLHQLAAEGLPAVQRLDRLRIVHGYIIGYVIHLYWLLLHIVRVLTCCSERKLRDLNNKFQVPSPRKTRISEYTNQLILEKLDDDPNQRRGPSTIKTLLAREGVQLPR